MDKDGIVSGACEAQEERRSFRWERSFHNVLAPTNDISEGMSRWLLRESGRGPFLFLLLLYLISLQSAGQLCWSI